MRRMTSGRRTRASTRPEPQVSDAKLNVNFGLIGALDGQNPFLTS